MKQPGWFRKWVRVVGTGACLLHVGQSCPTTDDVVTIAVGGMADFITNVVGLYIQAAVSNLFAA